MFARQPLASSAEVAEFLQKPIKTLDQWAYQGLGPRFSKVGRTRRYRWADVERWLDAQAVNSGEAA
jgi:hypothetical protein